MNGEFSLNIRKKIPGLLLALRPTQWTKNAIIFAAYIFALGDPTQGITLLSLWTVIQAVIIFCLLSSGIYLLNDIRDVELDRQHPTKRWRPIASGQVSTKDALTVSVILICASLAAAYLLLPIFFYVAAGYALMQIAYTFWLKHVAIIDLFVIAAGFVLRVVAGAVVIGVKISPWLLLCTLLLALFLALCKRRHEKVVLSATEGAARPSLENYDERLLDQFIGIVSAAIIITYAIYTLWPDTVAKFGTTHLCYTIPFVIFGIFRYLDLVYRLEKGDRPEKILLTDIPLIICIVLYGLSVLAIFSLPH